MVGCQFRFHPLYLKLKEILSSKRLGPPISARSAYGEYLPAWHPWEDYRKSYSAQEELGGGAILTLIHPLDYLYDLFGYPLETQCMMRRVPFLETFVEDDCAIINMKFPSSLLASVQVDFFQKPPVHILCIQCEGGELRLDFLVGRLDIVEKKGLTQTLVVPNGFERNALFLAEMEHFMASISSGRQTDIPFEQGMDVLNIAIEAKEYGKIQSRQ